MKCNFCKKNIKKENLFKISLLSEWPRSQGFANMYEIYSCDKCIPNLFKKLNLKKTPPIYSWVPWGPSKESVSILKKYWELEK